MAERTDEPYCPVCGSSDPAKGCPECGVPCGDPFHGDFNVVPVGLARELYEAVKAQPYHELSIEEKEALARYEREVGGG